MIDEAKLEAAMKWKNKACFAEISSEGFDRYCVLVAAVEELRAENERLKRPYDPHPLSTEDIAIYTPDTGSLADAVEELQAENEQLRMDVAQLKGLVSLARAGDEPMLKV